MVSKKEKENIRPQKEVTAEEEADNLLHVYGGGTDLSKCLDVIRHQFDVIQARSQLLLTLATLALTITGFSGPKIAQTNAFARYTIAMGISFVLAAVIVLLTGGLRIRWITQFKEDEPHKILSDIIRYRNRKTRLYMWELSLLVIGLAGYVASVITFLMFA